MENALKLLKLQIDRRCFKSILSGEQKVEHRFVYPHNANRYVVQDESIDEKGELILNVIPVHYDGLYLINGRRKDAPRFTIEVVSSEFVVLTDEEGNDMTFEENGEEYYVCQVWYHLGKVLNTENIPQNI